MRTIQLSALAAILLLSSSFTVKAITADEIIRKNIEARGGEASIRKIKTAKMTGNVSAMGSDIPIVQTLEIGKAMRLDITFMGATGYTIITNTDGWVYLPMQGQTTPTAMTPDQVKMSQPQLDLFGSAYDYKARGSKAEYLGEDTATGKKCYKVKLTDKNNNVQTAYFDESDYTQLRSVFSVEAEGQKTDIVTDYSDYKKQPEGVMLPMTINTMNGKVTLTAIELNKPVDPSLFKPAK